MPARDFAREFDQRMRDAEVPEVTAKVALLKALNADTLARLDNYITTRGGEDVAGLETTDARIGRISYPQILAYLKQGNLMDLAS